MEAKESQKDMLRLQELEYKKHHHHHHIKDNDAGSSTGMQKDKQQSHTENKILELQENRKTFGNLSTATSCDSIINAEVTQET